MSFAPTTQKIIVGVDYCWLHGIVLLN